MLPNLRLYYIVPCSEEAILFPSCLVLSLTLASSALHRVTPAVTSSSSPFLAHSTSPQISNFYFAVELSARRSSSLQILQPQILQVHKHTSGCNPHARLLQLLRDLCTGQTNRHHLHFFFLFFFFFADVRNSQRQK